MIEFEIAWEPRPKQGDRTRVAYSKSGKPFVAHAPDAKVKQDATNLAALMAPYVPPEPLEGPLLLCLAFEYPFNKSHGKRKRDLGILYKPTKPDLTNLIKQVEDVMQSSRFFINDSQIAATFAGKAHRKAARLRVRLLPLTDGQGLAIEDISQHDFIA